MASLKTWLYLGVCLSACILATADTNSVPKAEDVRWVSVDFKTVLTWTTKASNYSYTVLFSGDDSYWKESLYCIQVSESECDLTSDLVPIDRTYSADIQTELETKDYKHDVEESPHTFSPHFNPYRQSNISAVKFTVKTVDESKVIVNITDPLTSFHLRGKQLSIRDVLKKDLKYKISYYKSGSTGKKDTISDHNMAEVLDLDAGQIYCFMVAAFIPSRPKSTQQGAWSTQQCTQGHILPEWSLGALVGGVFTLLTVLVIIVTVIVCRCCRRRNKTLHTSQPSAPV